MTCHLVLAPCKWPGDEVGSWVLSFVRLNYRCIQRWADVRREQTKPTQIFTNLRYCLELTCRPILVAFKRRIFSVSRNMRQVNRLQVRPQCTREEVWGGTPKGKRCLNLSQVAMITVIRVQHLCIITTFKIIKTYWFFFIVFLFYFFFLNPPNAFKNYVDAIS